MPIFALINPDLTDTGRRRFFESPPPRPPVQTKPYYVPVVDQVNDISTGSDTVVLARVEIVQPNQLLRVQTIRDATPAELDARKDTTATHIVDGTTRVLALILYKVIRAGVTNDWSEFATITSPAAFKAYVKDLL